MKSSGGKEAGASDTGTFPSWSLGTRGITLMAHFPVFIGANGIIGNNSW